MKKTIVSFSLFALFALVYSACQKQSSTSTFDCSTSTYTYTTNVKPIMDPHCATSGCHSSGSSAGGYDLSTSSGCKSAQDRLSGCVQQTSGFKPMPQGASKLSDIDIRTISCWVKNGCM